MTAAADDFDGPDDAVADLDALDDLAEGLADHVERWALALGGAPGPARLAAEAARRLSLAQRQGHVCLEPAALAGIDRAALLASAVVGTPRGAPGLPLLLDDAGRLYLQRDFGDEQRLANRLLLAARAAPQPIAPDLRDLLQRLFDRPDAGVDDGMNDGAVDWQQLAVALALRQRLVLVSGGPGTGKTSTVLRLLVCLLAQDPGCRIALAAPTGKAAARMAEALAQRAAALPPGLPAELLERLPRQALTLHRLLGARPDGSFAHDAERPLAIDVLVVDEASMLDAALAARLLDAVPPQARIVLLGDQDQLAAVEAGAVFSELSADPSLSEPCRQALAEACGIAADALQTPPPRRVGGARQDGLGGARPPGRRGALQDTTVWLQRNYRFGAGSAIGRLAAQVNAGRTADALATLRAGNPALRWLDDGGPAPSAATMAACIDGYAGYLDALRAGVADPAVLLALFDGFRVLCARRDGPRGAAALNDRLDAVARQAGARAAAWAGPWYPGRPVLVLRNEPALRLANGDVGLALPDAEGRLQVVFALSDGALHRVAPARLPAHQSAFALTVHKAQGSEFDALLLLMPERRSAVATRELLYTAVTRARRRVTVAGSAAVLGSALQQPTRRHSGLLARIEDAAPR
ncbi:MAG: exodeoxyribonuclease V subunit alpha [Proteobacteria bacterium]|nr:exodeoxyribonuclease V subunit alpha [Pseudomonadota bacterium]